MSKPSSIGARIKARRAAAALSLRALEQRSGVSNAYISQLETGKVTNPSIGKLTAIAKGLKCGLGELVGGAR